MTHKVLEKFHDVIGNVVAINKKKTLDLNTSVSVSYNLNDSWNKLIGNKQYRYDPVRQKGLLNLEKCKDKNQVEYVNFFLNKWG